MQLNSIEELIEDIRQGKMVILMDDEDRENEGDLVMAAEHVTAEAINFMAKYGRGPGSACPCPRERCELLGSAVDWCRAMAVVLAPVHGVY